jgi:hypothetical protein
LLSSRRRLREEVGQAGAGEGLVDAVDRAAGALHQLQREIEVVLHLLARGQPPGDRRQRLQEGGDRLGVGRFPDQLKGVIDRRQRVFAEDAGDRRPFFEKGQHRFDATPHAAEEAPAVEVGADACGREYAQRVDQAGFEDFADLRETAVELRAVRCQALGPGGIRPLSVEPWQPAAQAKVASIA